MSGAGGAAAASAAAAAKKRREQREEEELTKYSNDDLEGWEFKIVRALSGKFKNKEVFRKVCDEEAKNGWELVEKFDNSRLRFKRRVDRRAQDMHAEVDPYRTHVGMSEKALVALILGIIAVIVVIIAVINAGM